MNTVTRLFTVTLIVLAACGGAPPVELTAPADTATNPDNVVPVPTSTVQDAGPPVPTQDVIVPDGGATIPEAASPDAPTSVTPEASTVTVPDAGDAGSLPDVVVVADIGVPDVDAAPPAPTHYACAGNVDDQGVSFAWSYSWDADAWVTGSIDGSDHQVNGCSDVTTGCQIMFPGAANTVWTMSIDVVTGQVTIVRALGHSNAQPLTFTVPCN